MCGINGIVNIETVQPHLSKIKEMNQQLAHRGPDSDGFWNDEHVAFGYRRLSIIDLSPLGNQPMLSPDGNLVLVFNGEIFNFKELKKELLEKGHSFRSSCDSEVILYAYAQWGTDAFRRFNGMFSLAIYDKLRKEIILARDHAGIKPLYYHLSGSQLIFSSEIRGFKAFNDNWPANENWPVYFLSFGFIPSPNTTLKDVYTLPKGSFLKLNISDFTFHIEPFHNFQFTHSISSETEALNRVRETMLEAVDRHMFSDAPLGIFLSGGIDSSLLALIADHLGHKNLNTLSITFSEATFNEGPYQDIVLKHMRPHNHQAYNVDSAMFINQIEDIFKAMDQPSWDGVNSYFISQCAHRAGLKAVLSGIGGDELFGGYPSFQRVGLLNKLKYVPSALFSMANYVPNDTLARLSFLNTDTEYKEYLFLRGAFTPNVVADIIGLDEKKVCHILSGLSLPGYPTLRDANLATFLETNVYMESQLLKDTDYMSMWHSLEVRVPFLDKENMELLHAIHPSVKFINSQPKYLLTKAFEDLLPREVVFRKKQGFTFPFSIWLKNNIGQFKPFLPDTKIANSITKKFIEGNIHWSRLWALMVLKHFQDYQ
jgi:asparagine synthase (glutamine-hydrolysing)